MVIIRQLPAPLRVFFDSLKPHFQRRAWQHVWALVLAIAIVTGRRNVSTLAQQIQAEVYRQKANDFLTLSPWQGPVVLQAAARQVLALLAPQPGELLEAILDAPGTRKRGQTMEAAHFYWDPQLKQKVWGHRFVLLILRIRGVVLPWALTLSRPKAFCRSPKGWALGLQCKTLSQLAADLLHTLPEDFRTFFQIRVLFDAGFFNQTVVGTCQALGWRYVSVAKANRAFWSPTSGRITTGASARWAPMGREFYGTKARRSTCLARRADASAFGWPNGPAACAKSAGSKSSSAADSRMAALGCWSPTTSPYQPGR